jgi:2-dehydro-3-deoxygluconokinase
MEHDLIALGETMLALAPPAGESLRSAATLAIDHAGAESNTCVGLARLGLQVAWVSRLGADVPGDRILAAVRDERVDVQWVERDERRSTGLMLKDPGNGVRYYRTESAASAMGPALLDPVPVAGARAVLVTGVTALISETAHAAGLALLERARGLRIVDPNLRFGLWGSHRRAELVLAFVVRCDLLLAGIDELAEILEFSRQSAASVGRAGAAGGSGQVTDSPEALARRVAALGPREVVVRGSGSVGVLADGSWSEIDIRRGAAVDPIGAGDAFNAGYIAARLRGGSVTEALHAGTRCGAAVTTAISDTSAFPRQLE